MMNICLVLHKYGIPLNDPCRFPLGFMYVSAMLKQAGHTVKVLNYNLYDYELEREVADQDAVLFTGFEEFRPYIIKDAIVCKNMGVRTILGGALATFEAVHMSEYVDTVVIGEGEEVLNLALNNRGIIKGSMPRLGRIPYPDYEGFGIEEYFNQHETRYMGVLTSRGCPYSCSFCAQTCYFQNRNLNAVFEEIDFYKAKYKIETIIFNDNTLNVRKRRFLEICNGMKQRDITWGAAIRADEFDEEMAAAAKESGCLYFVVGVESFSQKKLDYMNKYVKVKDIYATLNLLNEYAIPYHGNILVGFENESYEDIVKEIQSIPEEYNVFPCFVYPFIGTHSGYKRRLTGAQYQLLDNAFKGYVEAKGKYLYPVTEAK